MSSPNTGGGLKAPPLGNSGTLRDVWFDPPRHSQSTTTRFPCKLFDESLANGTKTEQCLCCFLLHKEVDTKLAKQVYGETRLRIRVYDLTVTGLRIDRFYTMSSKGAARATYTLPGESLRSAQKRINELRAFRKEPPINWEVFA